MIEQKYGRIVNIASVAGKDGNPNGSVDRIAGIMNKKRNVLGMMPHPERASEALLGCDDGRLIFESLIQTLKSQPEPTPA